jgi:hypothetical protein
MSDPQTTQRIVEDDDKVIRFGRLSIETVLTETDFYELKKWLRDHRYQGGTDTNFKPHRLVMEWEDLYEVTL